MLISEVQDWKIYSWLYRAAWLICTALSLPYFIFGGEDLDSVISAILRGKLTELCCAVHIVSMDLKKCWYLVA